MIRNGFALSLFDPKARDEPYAEELGLKGKFVASYVGTHGLAHGLDTILDAAIILQGKPYVDCLMVGAGAEKARLQQRAQELGLKNVVMLGQQPKDMMPKIWLVFEVSLVLLKKLDLFLTD